MRKRLTLAICLSLAVLLVGCGKQTSLPDFTTDTKLPVVTETFETDPSPSSPVTEATIPSHVDGSLAETIDSTSAATETIESSEADTVPVCEHEYRFKVTKQPSCTATGIRTYTCQKCGSTYNENIPLLDHAYVISERKADCTNSGTITHTCKECGHTYTEKTQPALGHAYGELKTLINPTELLPGLAEHTCTRCQFTEQISLPKLNPEK